MLVPVDELITKPEQGAVTGAPCITGAVEEDDVLSSSRLPDRLAVGLGPLLGVAIVVTLRVRTGVEHYIVRKPLPVVRHPP